MKKILTLALCSLAVCSVNAQKSVVDQANKLAGKIDQIGQARELIQQAMNNPETQNDVRTYYTAGKIEFDAFDKAYGKQMINPQDKDVNPLEMGQELINGFNAFEKALPLDSLPNEKGQVKPKYSKDMIARINSHFDNYFNAGGEFYNAQKYYPEAYEAFMIYGDLPSKPYASKVMKEIPDSVINTAYFNAGISAYAGNAVEQAATAFKRARKNNTDNAQTYIYEIACWQYMAQNDSTKVNLAKNEIEDIAKDGYKKFGMTQPIFINNLVNSLVIDNKLDEALALVDEQIAQTPENADVYGLRGFINDRKGDDDASVADYKKAASLPDVDFETLKNVCKKVYRVGAEKYNAIEGAEPEARNDVKVNYFQYAKDQAEKAKKMNPDDSDIDYVLENINYALETYFSK